MNAPLNTRLNAFGRLGLAALTLLLVACAAAPGASPTPSPSPSPSSTSPTPSPTPIPPVGLTGRQFLSTAVAKDGAPFQLAAGSSIRLTFEDGRLSANAGCNGIGGNLVLDGDKLIFSGASMTEMGCDPALMNQDNWLVAFLGSGPTFTLDGNNLTLTSGTTVVTLLDREVAEPDQPLVGPTWNLASIISGEVASSVPAGASASISFAADGTFEMNDGCNAAGGKYVVDGTTITFSEVIHTDMACTGARGQVEQAVLAVISFSGSVEFAIDAGSLSFTSGAAGLQFTATQQ